MKLMLLLFFKVGSDGIRLLPGGCVSELPGGCVSELILGIKDL